VESDKKLKKGERSINVYFAAGLLSKKKTAGKKDFSEEGRGKARKRDGLWLLSAEVRRIRPRGIVDVQQKKRKDFYIGIRTRQMGGKKVKKNHRVKKNQVSTEFSKAFEFFGQNREKNQQRLPLLEERRGSPPSIKEEWLGAKEVVPLHTRRRQRGGEVGLEEGSFLVGRGKGCEVKTRDKCRSPSTDSRRLRVRKKEKVEREREKKTRKKRKKEKVGGRDQNTRELGKSSPPSRAKKSGEKRLKNKKKRDRKEEVSARVKRGKETS